MATGDVLPADRGLPGQLVSPGLRRALFHGLVLAGLIFCAYLFLVAAPQKGTFAFDVAAYWSVDPADPYHARVGDFAFFAYSPAAALILAPFTLLPFLAFAMIWYWLLLTALFWLGRRDVLVLLAFPPVAIELYHGNIHLLMAAAIVLGFRYPPVWAFVLLTKVSPGIGLLWFAARREWRALGLALGATAAITLVTLVLMPNQWADWITLLTRSAAEVPPWPAIPSPPLWMRLPLAAAIVWWGARRDARWTVPIAATLALPVIWVGGLAILVACWPLRSRRHEPDRQDAAVATE